MTYGLLSRRLEDVCFDRVDSPSEVFEMEWMQELGHSLTWDFGSLTDSIYGDKVENEYYATYLIV